MKKMLFLLTISLSVPMMVFSLVEFAEEARADGLSNAREEMAYGYHAMMQRQEEQSRQNQLQQYQQQQYMQQQQLMNQQNMYNQTHRSGDGLNPSIILGGRR